MGGANGEACQLWARGGAAVGWLLRGGVAMSLLLWLGLSAALARGCLHCHGNFSDKFSFYRHHVNLKSWWVGDIPVSGSLLSDWSQDTMRELHLAIPAEISEGAAAPNPTPCRAGPTCCAPSPALTPTSHPGATCWPDPASPR